MIAKAATISHGGNAVRYSVNKDSADIVLLNFLPEGLSAEAMYQRMVLKQKELAHLVNRGKPLKRNMIRMEISPTKEESAGWTPDDWARLANEYISVFDSIDLSKRTKRAGAKSTNIAGSQYVAVLHRDSKSGILHLHIDANRIDMDGKINDDHLIAERAMAAARIVNRRRNWGLPEDIYERRRQEIADACMEVLRTMPKFSWEDYEAGLKERGYGVNLQRDGNDEVRGYSVQVGNSTYKSSVLGKGRHLMPSKIKATWARLHGEGISRPTPTAERGSRTAATPPKRTRPDHPSPVIRHYDIATDEHHSYHVAIPEEADEIIRRECAVPEDNPFATIEDVQRTALLLFAEYLDAATSMAASGGGGGSDTGGWGKDKDEDEREWARRCARMANSLCKRRKGMRR